MYRSRKVANRSTVSVTATYASCTVRTVRYQPIISKYADNLQTQKDLLIENFANYIARSITTKDFMDNMNTIEQRIMTECATIANTPGCC